MFMRVLALGTRLGVSLSAHVTSIPVDSLTLPECPRYTAHGSPRNGGGVAHPSGFKGAVFEFSFAVRITASQFSTIHRCVRRKNRDCSTANPSDRRPSPVSLD